MTGVQLALQAAARGASSVTLITRHKLCVRALNCKARCFHVVKNLHACTLTYIHCKRWVLT